MLVLAENKSDNVVSYEQSDDNQEQLNTDIECHKRGKGRELFVEFICILDDESDSFPTTFTMKFTGTTDCESQIQIWRVIRISCGKVSQSINLLSAMFTSLQA